MWTSLKNKYILQFMLNKHYLLPSSLQMVKYRKLDSNLSINFMVYISAGVEEHSEIILSIQFSSLTLKSR